MEQSGSGNNGFEVALTSYRWKKGRINGVRYRGYGDDMRLALSAMGDSAYSLDPRGPDPDTPDMDKYRSSGIQAGRVVRDAFE